MRLSVILLFVAVLTVSAVSQKTQPSKPASKVLHDLFDAEWEYSMREHPEGASALGDRRWNDRWTDDSMQAIERRHRHTLEVLASLEKINRGSLSSTDQLNYDLFKQQRERGIEGYRFRMFLIPLN